MTYGDVNSTTSKSVYKDYRYLFQVFSAEFGALESGTGSKSLWGNADTGSVKKLGWIHNAANSMDPKTLA
jgi:hypothetical protein